MRVSTTICSLLLASAVWAQPSGGQLFFDGADALYLDSVYPAGCWQVGHPDKPVFTSAYSEPNALVTDTVLPHMPSNTCYAQFTMIADDPGVLGKAITFRHWMDMDTLESFGWVEKQNTVTGTWQRTPFSDAYFIWMEGDGVIWTDTGYVFTGRSFGWYTSYLYIECMGVLWDPDEDRGGDWSDTTRLRFAFSGSPNVNGRDGWMIDDINVDPVQCSGGVEAISGPQVKLFPDPAQDFVDVVFDPAWGPPRIHLINAWGQLSGPPAEVDTGRIRLDVHDLPPGNYGVLTTFEQRTFTERLIIAR